MYQPLVSFCIPTYNGMKYLPELVASLLPQLDDRIEIIFSDDVSTDGTYEYCQELAKIDNRIFSFQNTKNLGMDRNFHNAVKKAKGQYVWLSGQDDIFGKGAYQKFIQVLQHHPNTRLFYFNFQQIFTTHPLTLGEVYIKRQKDFYAASAEEYFSLLDRAPSFLPAIVMYRELWDRHNLEVFYGSLYVQVGCWLLNCKDQPVYYVANPSYIGCRCPAESWKARLGKMAFATRIGTAYTYCVAARQETYPPVVRAWEKIEKKLEKEFSFYAILNKAAGMEVTKELSSQIHTIFGNRRLFYYGYILPCLHTPLWLAKGIAYLYSTPIGKKATRYVRRLLSPV